MLVLCRLEQCIRDCEDEESESLNMREDAISGVRPMNLGHDGIQFVETLVSEGEEATGSENDEKMEEEEESVSQDVSSGEDGEKKKKRVKVIMRTVV